MRRSVPRRSLKTDWEAHDKGKGTAIAHRKDGIVREVIGLMELVELSQSGKVLRFEKVGAE